MQETMKSFSHLVDGFIQQRRLMVKAERGSALVELALTMPILILLFVGAAEFASLSYASIEVSNAARAVSKSVACPYRCSPGADPG